MIGVVPTSIPSIKIKSQVLTHDTGADGADGITSDGAVILTGLFTGATGSSVRIYDGSVFLGLAALGATGSWSFSRTLSAGAHALSAVVVQPSGATASSAAASAIKVVTTKPTVTIGSQTLAQDTGVSATDRITSNGAVALSGAVSSAVGTVVKIFDGPTLLGSATLDGKGGWSFATTLKNGSHVLTAVATDIAGNSATSAPAPSIAVDTTKPTVSFSVIDRAVGSKVVSLYGTFTGVAGTSIEIYNGTTDLGAATITSAGLWKFQSPVLTSGNYQFSAVATSLAGATATFSGAPSITVGSARGQLDPTKFHTVWDQDFTQNQIDPNLFPIHYGAADQFTYGASGLTLSSHRAEGFSDVGLLQPTWSASGDQGYGLYSVTASVPAKQGKGVALLLWPSNNVWPGPELDMVENWSDPTGQSAVFSVHAKNPVDGSNFVDSIHYAVDLTKPNTFSLDWEAGSLTYYVNGQELFQLTGSEVPKDYAHGGVNAAFGAQITGIGDSYEPTDTVALTVSDINYKTLAPAPPSITVSNPGAITMTGAGSEIVYETIRGTNLGTSTVYVLEMNAKNVAYNGWRHVTLDALGVASVAFMIRATGDYLVVATNPTGAGVTGCSAPASLTRATVASSALSESVSHDRIWLERSGDDLVVDILGTNHRDYVDNWFSNGASVSKIITSDGFTLNAGIAPLESAMSAFETSHPAFNFMTTTHMTLNDAFFAGTVGGAAASLWRN